MKIRELFRGDIERPIETVIHVDLSDEAIVAHEIEEYVVTENIREHLEELADCYADTARNPSESTNVWVSGFFGSGKSSFAKTVGYALANPSIEGRTATDRLLARANSHKLEALLTTAHTQAPTIAVFLDLASGRDMLREGESLVLPVYRGLLKRLGYSSNELLAELEITLPSLSTSRETVMTTRFAQPLNVLTARSLTVDISRAAFSVSRGSRSTPSLLRQNSTTT